VFVTIDHILNETDAAAIRDSLEVVPWRHGLESATTQTSDTKNNQQLRAADDPRVQAASTVVADALLRKPDFHLQTFPRRLCPPLFARYTKGMFYRRHLDSALMGAPSVRTDFAITVGLVPPDSYDGGWLQCEGQAPIKPSLGGCVLYPAGSVHEVTEVTRGVRLVAVLWAESWIPDPRRRTILRELEEASRRTWDLGVRTTYQDLLRLWAR